MSVEDVISRLNSDMKKVRGFNRIAVSRTYPGNLVAYTRVGFCFDTVGTHEILCSNESMVMKIPSRIKICTCNLCTGGRRVSSKLPSLTEYEYKLEKMYDNKFGLDKIILRTYSSGMVRAKSGFCIGINGRHEIDFDNDVAMERFLERIKPCRCGLCLDKHGKVYTGRESEYTDDEVNPLTKKPSAEAIESVIEEFKNTLLFEIIQKQNDLFYDVESRDKLLDTVDEIYENYLNGRGRYNG